MKKGVFMQFLSNAHTHTSYCDGKNSITEMLQAAQKLGFVSLGFSGHADQGFDHAYSMGQGRQAAYFKALKEMQSLMQQQKTVPRIWVGLEEDAFVDDDCKSKNKAEFDYIIGSTHYLCRDFQGQCVSVDGDVAVLRNYVQKQLDGDMLAMVKQYYDIHVHHALLNRPDIIGHFDIVCKYASKEEENALFDEQSKAYRRIALNALEAVRTCEAVLEVNVGSMVPPKKRLYPYPSRELLGAWRELKGEVTLTSDCHDAAYLDYKFSETLHELKTLGYRYVKRLGTGNELWETIEMP